MYKVFWYLAILKYTFPYFKKAIFPIIPLLSLKQERQSWVGRRVSQEIAWQLFWRVRVCELPAAFLETVLLLRTVPLSHFIYVMWSIKENGFWFTAPFARHGVKVGWPCYQGLYLSSKVIHSCEHRARVTDERCPWLCATGIRQTPCHHRGPQAVFSGCPHGPPQPRTRREFSCYAVSLVYNCVFFLCWNILGFLVLGLC